MSFAQAVAAGLLLSQTRLLITYSQENGRVGGDYCTLADAVTVAQLCDWTITLVQQR